MIISTFARWKEKVVQSPTPTHEELLALDAEVRKHLHFPSLSFKRTWLKFYSILSWKFNLIIVKSCPGPELKTSWILTSAFSLTPFHSSRWRRTRKPKSWSRSENLTPQNKKSFPPHFFPGRFLNSRPVLGFVATSTFPLLASSANHPPSVRQNDCLVSFRVVLGILVREARGQEFSYLFRHNFNFCNLQILQGRKICFWFFLFIWRVSSLSGTLHWWYFSSTMSGLCLSEQPSIYIRWEWSFWIYLTTLSPNTNTQNNLLVPILK